MRVFTRTTSLEDHARFSLPVTEPLRPCQKYLALFFVGAVKSGSVLLKAAI